MRNRYLFGTWKNRLTWRESLGLALWARGQADDRPFSLGVCPSFISLREVVEIADSSSLLVAAQNSAWNAKVSFTGEISPAVLRDLGCRFAILGHSERRLYLNETDEMIALKIEALRAEGITPILCVGETLEERRSEQFEAVIGRQLSATGQVELSPKALIVAYEPTWAISTSVESMPLSPEIAQECHAWIRTWLADKYGDAFARDMSIIYGGSVTGANAESYFGQPDIDGGLVGTASQTQGGFEALVGASTRAFEAKSSQPRA